MVHSENEYANLLLTTVKDFFIRMRSTVRLKNALNDSPLMKKHPDGILILKLLNTSAMKYDKYPTFGMIRYKELLDDLYEFGIKDIEKYPIVNEPSKRVLTEKYIEECITEMKEM